MSLTLESLLSQLEGEAGLNKQASDDKEEKKEDGKEKGSFPFFTKKDDSKSDDKKDEKEEKSDDKEEKKEDKKEEKDEERTKEARLAGSALAQEIMQKIASAKTGDTQTPTESKEQEMNKQASERGQALAAELLEKLANVGDQNTSNGIAPTAQPNKVQIDVANVVKEDDAKIKPMPGAGGSFNQIYDAIIADALSQGAASTDQVHTTGVTPKEGGATSATPAQVGTESAEKTAALVALTNSGIDFDSAIELIKAAQEEIDAEEEQTVKAAALQELIDNGVDYNLAVALVKSAGILSSPIVGKAVNFATSNVGKTVGAAVVGGAAGYGLKSAVRGQEKKAALDRLTEQGVDYDQAVALIDAKATQLFGK